MSGLKRETFGGGSWMMVGGGGIVIGGVPVVALSALGRGGYVSIRLLFFYVVGKSID